MQSLSSQYVLLVLDIEKLNLFDNNYMSLQIDQDKLIGINGKEIDHLWSSPKCSQQQRGRNGTLIVNLGGTRTFHVVAAEMFGSISKVFCFDAWICCSFWCYSVK